MIETGNLEKKTDSIFAADIIHLSAVKQPSDKVRVQIPLHDDVSDVEDVVVFIVNNEDDLEDDRKWRELDSPVNQQNDCISFWIKRFCMYVFVHVLYFFRSLKSNEIILNCNDSIFNTLLH